MVIIWGFRILNIAFIQNHIKLYISIIFFKILTFFTSIIDGKLLIVMEIIFLLKNIVCENHNLIPSSSHGNSLHLVICVQYDNIIILQYTIYNITI